MFTDGRLGLLKEFAEHGLTQPDGLVLEAAFETGASNKQRRYHLVHRAIKAGELLRLRRGSYLLAESFRDYPIHPFALAQAFVPGSYVSYETALAH